MRCMGKVGYTSLTPDPDQLRPFPHLWHERTLKKAERARVPLSRQREHVSGRNYNKR
jgi:hypothetical protein